MNNLLDKIKLKYKNFNITPRHLSRIIKDNNITQKDVENWKNKDLLKDVKFSDYLNDMHIDEFFLPNKFDYRTGFKNQSVNESIFSPTLELTKNSEEFKKRWGI